MSGLLKNAEVCREPSGDALLSNRAWGRLWAVAGMLLAVACGGGGGDSGGCGGGCGGGCDTTPYPENAPAVENGAQVRVTEHGLTFLEDNASALVGQLLDGGLSFCLPEGTDPVTLCNQRTCPSSGETGCELSMELLDVSIDAVEPNRVAATAVIGGLDPETDFIEVNLLSNCLVRLGTRDNAGLPATIFADMTVDPNTRDVSISLDEEAIQIDFDRLTIEIDAQNFLDIFICEGIDLLTDIGFVRDLLFDNVAGPLLGTVTGLTDQFLCRACETNADCPRGSSCGQQGDVTACIDPNTESCVPAVLGLEGVMDFGSLLAGVSPGLEAEIAFQMKAHGYADAIANGLSIGLKGGMAGDKSECVPAVPPPSQNLVPQSQILRSNTSPRGEPFHIGFGISKAFMDTSLWGIYNGGGLCLAIGTNTIDLLSSGTFGTLLPSLKELTRNQNTPFTLQMAPKEPPTVTIGAGVIDPDTGDLIEPLLTLVWENLDMNFYAFFDDRMVRIMTLNVDMVIPLALDVTDEGLVPVIGDLTDAFERVEVRDSQLLTEEEAFIQGLLPSLIGVALPLLGDALANPIELPEFSGFQLDLSADSLMGIENNTMLGLFANLALAPPGMEQPIPKIDTDAQLIDLLLPPEALLHPSDEMSERDRLAALMAARPVATVQMNAQLWGQPLPEGEATYSYRLDGGIWSSYRKDPLLVIDDPSLLLQGTHNLEVRARIVGQWQTLDPTPAVVKIPIDFERPEVNLTLEEAGVVISGYDVVTRPESLAFQVRVNGSDWSEWAPALDLSTEVLKDFAPIADIEVKVRDASGKEGYTRRTFPIHGRVTRTDAGTGCECATVASPAGSKGSAWWLFAAAFGLFFVSRRRRRGQGEGKTPMWPFMMLIVSLTLFGAACSDDKPGAGNQQQGCPEGCEVDQMCVAGVCEDIVCAGDEDCPDGLSCVDGACVALDRCSDTDDCPDGLVCVDGTCSAMGCGSDDDCANVDCGGSNPICDQGQCACEPPCADGCGDNEFCCESQNECTELPDPCAGMDCMPGFRADAISLGEGDPKTCEVTGAECNCVELDPLPEGDIGRFFDATVVGDRVVLSAYNETYGDLMVGVLGESDTFAWTFVDGVPEGAPVTGSVGGPRDGIGGRGDNVGLYTSIAADEAGNLHITYRDETNQVLKYAHGQAQGESWTFTTHVLDAEGDTGVYSALSMGPDGFPAVAYMARAVPVDDPARPVALTKLRWAKAGSADPGADGWGFTDLDTQEIDFACGGGCPTGQKCRADTNVCERTLAGSRCDDACNTGEQCFEDGCFEILTQPSIVSLPEGTGLFARVARFADGDPAVVYYHRTGGDLMYVRQENGTWLAPIILDGRDPEGEDLTDAGTFCDIAIDGNDNVHISYVDAVTDDLRYIDLSANLSELVDDGVRVVESGVSVDLVGDASSIIIGPDGAVRIAYQDATQHLLMLARRTNNAWQVLKVAGGTEPYTGAYGFYNQQVTVGDQALSISYRYQRQTDPPENGLTVHRF